MMEIRGFVAGPGRKWHIATAWPQLLVNCDGEWIVSAAVECEQAVHWQRWRDRPGKEGICRNCIRAIEQREKARRQAQEAQEAQQRSAEEIEAERKRERRRELGSKVEKIMGANPLLLGFRKSTIRLRQDKLLLRIVMFDSDDAEGALLDRPKAAELAFLIGEFAATGRLPTRAWLGDAE